MDTKKRIIIVVDLGHFKAYRVTKAPMESAKTTLIESYDSIDGHGKLSDKLSDSAGRFGVGGGKNGSAKGYGEPHNLHTENEKKLIRMIAKDINSLIKRENCTKWHFASVKRINKQIVKLLHPDIKAKLDKNITSDLTNVASSEILGYFK
jgi:hypothetical protein